MEAAEPSETYSRKTSMSTVTPDNLKSPDLKYNPRTGHKDPEGEQKYSSTLPPTSALDGGWVVNATPRPLYPL